MEAMEQETPNQEAEIKAAIENAGVQLSSEEVMAISSAVMAVVSPEEQAEETEDAPEVGENADLANALKPKESTLFDRFSK